MNKLVVLAFFITSISYAQQYNYGSGGNVLDENNKRVKADNVRQLLKNNQEALNQFNAGRSKKTWGNVLFYGGIGLATLNLVTAVYGDSVTSSSSGQLVENRVTPTLAIIGGSMFLASIPVKIGYPKKVRTAINALNERVSYNEKTRPELLLVANGNGLGFKLSF
jgi:hypothetical protein